MVLEVMGTSVAVEQAGTGDKQVLLLHGWGCTMEHFAPITRELAGDYRVTALDFPGHGRSGRPPEPWGVPEYAECVRQTIGKLGIAPCDIIAHSFGGRVALHLVADSPELVKRLVLTGGAGLKKPQTEEQKKKSEAFQKKKKLLQRAEKLPLLGHFAEDAEEKLRQKYGSADYNALDAEMRKTFVKVVSEDLRPLLPKVKASTLLIWGEKDDATPLWMGQTMEKEIPDAGLVVFENDDHFAYLHQWPRFVTIVRAFLN